MSWVRQINSLINNGHTPRSKNESTKKASTPFGLLNQIGNGIFASAATIVGANGFNVWYVRCMKANANVAAPHLRNFFLGAGPNFAKFSFQNIGRLPVLGWCTILSVIW